MKTKSADKPEEVAVKTDAVKAAPVAAKPLSKVIHSEAVVAAKPLASKAKSAAAVKVVAAAKAEVVKEVKAEKVVKKPKLKVVRDSFTMPQNEYEKIADIKALCLKAGVQVKKSEVLRAGVIALCALDEAQLNAAMGALDKIKTGRPNKH